METDMQIGIFLVVLVLISVVSLGLLIWAIVDIAKSEFPGNGKLIWLLVVLLAGLIGVIIYFAVGRAQKMPLMEGTPGRNPFEE